MSSRMAAARGLWELFQWLADMPQGEKTVFRSYGRMQRVSCSRSTYKKRLKRFESQGLVKMTKTPAGPAFVITSKAKDLRRKAIIKQNRTDGMGTLIIFDIPEDKRNARDTFRRYLIRSGYTQIRESTFLSPFQVFDDLKGLIKELKLEKNVSFFAVKAEYYF